jgi:RHS repeat-associated protein
MYLGKDIMGSVRSVTVDSGAVEDRYEYDAFGQPYKGDLSGGMNLGYTGKPYDTSTGLYNYGYRDYKPQAARFTTVDPIRDGRNWHAYVNNDPVNYVDLWGLAKDDVRSLPQRQTPNDPSKNHCDINARNNALDHGFDPRAQDGSDWDGNGVTVPELFDKFPDNRNELPPANTSGFAFSPRENPEHVIFYERGEGTSYKAHQSDGIEPTTSYDWSIYGEYPKDAYFVPLPSLPEDPNSGSNSSGTPSPGGSSSSLPYYQEY